MPTIRAAGEGRPRVKNDNNTRQEKSLHEVKQTFCLTADLTSKTGNKLWTLKC